MLKHNIEVDYDMSRRNFRRFRHNVPLVRGSRRPTDKELIYVAQTCTTSNTTTTLKTATFPCTIVGLRWNLAFKGVIATSASTINWIIVLVHDGNSANTISQSNGADMYTPENDVMAFGTVMVNETDQGVGPMIAHVQGQTKTMRKMQQGDLLQFISLSSVSVSAKVDGVVQFFCKS